VADGIRRTKIDKTHRIVKTLRTLFSTRAFLALSRRSISEFFNLRVILENIAKNLFVLRNIPLISTFEPEA
jgi:cob(I)alamin adenosyltransferase